MSSKRRRVDDTHLVVDQTPLFEECVHTHDSTDISSKISTTCCKCQVFARPESVCINHKVTIILVNGRCFGAVS